MRRATIFSFIALALCFPAGAVAQQAEQPTITIRVKAERYVDAVERISIKREQDVFGKELEIRPLLIDKESLGLAEVFVSTERFNDQAADDEEMKSDREPTTHKIAFENGDYSPRVLVAEQGDTIRFLASRQVATNPNTRALWHAGLPFSLAQGTGYIEGIPDHNFDKLARVTCAIRPWPQANIYVMRDTHCCLTDESGECELPVPPNREAPIYINLSHPKLGKLEVVKASNGVDVRRNGWLRVTAQAKEVEVTVKVPDEHER